MRSERQGSKKAVNQGKVIQLGTGGEATENEAQRAAPEKGIVRCAFAKISMAEKRIKEIRLKKAIQN